MHCAANVGLRKRLNLSKCGFKIYDLLVFFMDERTSYMMVSYSALKKRGKENVKFRRSGTLNEQYELLLSNCSEYRPNNSTNIQWYLDSRKPVCHTGRHVHAKLSHSPSFIAKFIDYSSLIICLLLDVLVVSLYIFTRCLYFDLLYGLVKIQHNT